MNTDLEFLRAVFADNRVWVDVGIITAVGLSNDFGVYRAQVKLLSDDREVICHVGFDDPYEVTIPQLEDFVMVAFASGAPDEAHVIKTFHNSKQTIPLWARTGHSVKYARPGKKMVFGSDSAIYVGRTGNTLGTSPLVLGDVLVNFLTAILNAFLNAAQIGQCGVGPVFLDPAVRTALTTAIDTYITESSSNILSQIAYTER